WRWAEPDNGFGVSGDPVAAHDQFGAVRAGSGQVRAINNNAIVFGGGICDWNLGYASSVSGAPAPLTGYAGGFNNNCGPNDEIFGFHGNGANMVFWTATSASCRPTRTP